ncbi:MAG: DUF4124 domain-containing protein [Xanthomonadaceae bacterium]|nr:DUF4124 domain-containing protein [Xanthomonadaceae bacterium]
MKRLLIVIILSAFPVLAAAQSVYKWVDEDGEVHYSQALPPERAASGHDRLTKDGLLAERVDRAPTGQERLELQRRLELERDQAEQQRIRDQQDRLFLASFPTEQDIQQRVDASREGVERDRRVFESRIDQVRERFADAVRQAAALERRGEPVPEDLSQRIGAARIEIKDLNERIRGLRQRHDDLDQQLSHDLERHRRITADGQDRSRGDPAGDRG